MAMFPVAVFSFAGPAQAWGYCTNTGSRAEAITYVYFYDNQGYCGAQWGHGSEDVLVCHNLTGFPENNQVAAASNRWGNRKLTMYNNANCTGENFSLAAFTSHPNLYSTSVGIGGMGNEVSSWQLSYS